MNYRYPKIKTTKNIIFLEKVGQIFTLQYKLWPDKKVKKVIQKIYYFGSLTLTFRYLAVVW